VRYVQPLTDEQRTLLAKPMQEESAFRARSRAHSLLLSAAGTPIQAIAKTSQGHRVTVSAWSKPWAQQGAQRVQDPPRRGRPSTRPPDAQALAQP
jgi:transposase